MAVIRSQIVELYRELREAMEEKMEGLKNETGESKKKA